MPNLTVYIVTDAGFFGQTRKPWVGIDIERLCHVLTRGGVHPVLTTFQDIGTGIMDIRHSHILYTFSQKQNTRLYIIDVVRHLTHGSNLLIPSLDLLLCHENKGYQELYRRQRDLPRLPGAYVMSGVHGKKIELDYPLVVKTVDGSNGNGVFLARNESELHRIVRRITPHASLLTRMDLVRRKYFRRKKSYVEYPNYNNRDDYEQYSDYIIPKTRFIVQKFIPRLEFDFRVLAMSNRFFVMKRHVLSGDFRASGTKRFDFDFDAPDDLLDFAHDIVRKIQTPFLSMDICPYDHGYALLEFQALHFGISAVKKSRGHYSFEDETWRFHAVRSEFETVMAEALVNHLSLPGAETR